MQGPLPGEESGILASGFLVVIPLFEAQTAAFGRLRAVSSKGGSEGGIKVTPSCAKSLWMASEYKTYRRGNSITAFATAPFTVSDSHGLPLHAKPGWHVIRCLQSWEEFIHKESSSNWAWAAKKSQVSFTETPWLMARPWIHDQLLWQDAGQDDVMSEVIAEGGTMAGEAWQGIDGTTTQVIIINPGVLNPDPVQVTVVRLRSGKAVVFHSPKVTGPAVIAQKMGLTEGTYLAGVSRAASAASEAGEPWPQLPAPAEKGGE